MIFFYLHWTLIIIWINKTYELGICAHFIAQQPRIIFRNKQPKRLMAGRQPQCDPGGAIKLHGACTHIITPLPWSCRALRTMKVKGPPVRSGIQDRMWGRGSLRPVRYIIRKYYSPRYYSPNDTKVLLGQGIIHQGIIQEIFGKTPCRAVRGNNYFTRPIPFRKENKDPPLRRGG